MAEGDESFEAHRRAQLERWARTTPAERLAWLWQAKVFASRALGAASRAGRDTAEEPPPAPPVEEPPGPVVDGEDDPRP